MCYDYEDDFIRDENGDYVSPLDDDYEYYKSMRYEEDE